MELNREQQVLNADWCRELVPGAPYFSVFYFEPGLNIPLEGARRNEISAESVVTFSLDAVGGVADIDGLLVLIGGLARRMKLGIGWDRILPDE